MLYINGGNELIYILISLEIMLISIALFFTYISFQFDDILGNILAFLILPIAGVESALGLALILFCN